VAENKKSFIIYCDLIHVVSKLPNDKAGELFKHILEYVNDLNPETDDLLLQVLFEPIKLQLKRDLKKWESESLKRSDSGRIGGFKSGEARRNQKEANEASASKTKQTQANEAVTVTVTDTVTVNVIDKEKDFYNQISEFKEKYTKEMLSAFFNHWSQKDKKGKMKFESERFFEIGKRLATWKANESKFSKTSFESKTAETIKPTINYGKTSAEYDG
jgi:hypothetical protein